MKDRKMSREHFSIRNFNDSSFNYKYFVRINNKISKFINFHPNIYTYESLKIIAIANYTHMLDIFASYKLNRWKSVDSPEWKRACFASLFFATTVSI